jgi:two-component system response regulator
MHDVVRLRDYDPYGSSHRMRPKRDADPITILLVEDNPGDVLLAKEALRDARFPSELHVVRDGEQAMAFLRRQDPYADVPSPDLVLLDLNLPRKDGREVLAEVKEDFRLRRIPVVVLTTSDSDEDVTQAYDHMVNAYIRKPVDLPQLVEVFRSIDQFWGGIVTLPPLPAETA